MNSDETTRTSPTLLKRVGDSQDHTAWHEFVVRYEPHIRRWCREYRLSDDLAEEVSQLFLIGLVDKMRSFRYDPSRRFRGWLRRGFHWRAVEAIRELDKELIVFSLDDPLWIDVKNSLLASNHLDEEDDQVASQRLLVELAEQVQATVREKVHAQSWKVFWHVSIEGWTIRQTADAMKMSYLAAYRAHARVAERLAKEGERQLAGLMSPNNDARVCPP